MEDDKQRVMDRLQQIATQSGLVFNKEYHIRGTGSSVDAVWLKPIGGLDPIPVAAFEIETERIPKHVKGSIFNLNWLGAGLRVIILIGSGISIADRTAKLVQDSHSPIEVWREPELDRLLETTKTVPN